MSHTYYLRQNNAYQVTIKLNFFSLRNLKTESAYFLGSGFKRLILLIKYFRKTSVFKDVRN